MTTTLSSPNTATLGMDGAASLTIAMFGKATIAFTSANDDVWPSFTVTNAQSKTYGPYGINMSVVITALDGSLTYQVNGGVPGFGYDADSNITSLVDGAGNAVSLGDGEVVKRGVDSYQIGLQYASVDSAASGSVCFDGTASYPNKLGVTGTKPVEEPVWGTRTNDSYTTGTADVATILGGYDNVNNALAGHIISQHSMISAGADHASIFGGSLHTILDDTDYSVILGGSSNYIQGRGRYSAIISGDSCTIETGASDALAGFRSFIAASNGTTIGGRNGTALSSAAANIQSTYGTVLGGETVTLNELAGTHVTVGGANITVGASASAAYSLIHGEALTVDGDRCLVIGDNHDVDYSYVVATGGRTKAPFIGAKVHSSRARANTVGASMSLDFQCSQETTDTTTTRLSVNGSNSYPRQPENSIIHGTAYVTARNTATGACACYRIDFVSEQGTSGATPTLRKNTTTTDYDGLTIGTVPTINTTADIFRVQVVGLAATNIAWNCRVVATVTA